MVEEPRWISVEEVFEGKLSVPEYQRPYRWRPETARALLEDTWYAYRHQPEMFYAMGSLVLCHRKGRYEIVDGQQRLLTLRMLLALLVGESLISQESLQKKELPPIVVVWKHLSQSIRMRVPKENREGFREFIRNKCMLVRVVTDDEDEAFRFFDAQNYRGKRLRPHDLLKAHHLRALGEMDREKRTKMVEEWEKVDDGVLEDLFNVLYRVARWAQGKSAEREFSEKEIVLFKGIPEKREPLPNSTIGMPRTTRTIRESASNSTDRFWRGLPFLRWLIL